MSVALSLMTAATYSNHLDSYDSFYECQYWPHTRVVDPITIRRAELTDAEAIALIYNQGIEDRLATLETETCPWAIPVSVRARLAARIA